VKADSVEYTVKVGYQFAASVTEAEVKTSVARAVGVPEEKVKVTLTVARRLMGGSAVSSRRLQSTRVDATIKTSQVADVQTIQTKAGNASAVASELSSVKNVAVAAPAVTAAPQAGVEVVTAVDAPTQVFTPQAITSVMQQVSQDTGATVQVTPAAASATRTTTERLRISGARPAGAMSALVGAVLMVAAAAA